MFEARIILLETRLRCWHSYSFAASPRVSNYVVSMHCLLVLPSGLARQIEKTCRSTEQLEVAPKFVKRRKLNSYLRRHYIKVSIEYGGKWRGILNRYYDLRISLEHYMLICTVCSFQKQKFWPIFGLK